jgi:hypothetical protein
MLPIYTIDTLRKHKQPGWVIESVIPDRSSIIMYGPPGCGKTFTALDIALHIAHDKEWQGKQIQRAGAVVYMVAEGLYGIAKRCQAWHKYHNLEITENLFVVPFHTVTLWKDETIQELYKTLEKVCDTSPISLIIVDTLSRAMSGLEENSSKDAIVFLQQMESLKEKFQCSMMFVHHAGKDATRGMRGSSALLASVDTCVMIQNNTNQIKWLTQKQKDGERVELNFNMVKTDDSMIIVPHETSTTVKMSCGNGGRNNNVVLDQLPCNHGQLWTTEQDEWVLKALQRGLTHADIGNRMQRTHGGIVARLRRLIRERKWAIEEAMEKTKLSKDVVEKAIRYNYDS